MPGGGDRRSAGGKRIGFRLATPYPAEIDIYAYAYRRATAAVPAVMVTVMSASGMLATAAAACFAFALAASLFAPAATLFRFIPASAPSGMSAGTRANTALTWTAGTSCCRCLAEQKKCARERDCGQKRFILHFAIVVRGRASAWPFESVT